MDTTKSSQENQSFLSEQSRSSQFSRQSSHASELRKQAENAKADAEAYQNFLEKLSAVENFTKDESLKYFDETIEEIREDFFQTNQKDERALFDIMLEKYKTCHQKNLSNKDNPIEQDQAKEAILFYAISDIVTDLVYNPHYDYLADFLHQKPQMLGFIKDSEQIQERLKQIIIDQYISDHDSGNDFSFLATILANYKKNANFVDEFGSVTKILALLYDKDPSKDYDKINGADIEGTVEYCLNQERYDYIVQRFPYPIKEFVLPERQTASSLGQRDHDLEGFSVTSSLPNSVPNTPNRRSSAAVDDLSPRSPNASPLIPPFLGLDLE